MISGEMQKDRLCEILESMEERLKEYLAWRGLPEEIYEIAEQLEFGQSLLFQSPERYDALGGESGERYVGELEGVTNRLYKLSSWLADELDGLHAEKWGCFDNCPFWQKMKPTHPGFAELN